MIAFPLTPEQRTVYWTVAVFDTYGSVHRSSGRQSASAVRQKVEVYRSRRALTRAADTAVLAAAVLTCARKHGAGPVLKVAS